MTVPVAFVVQAIRTADGLRIHQIDERSAKTAEAACDVLINECSWPAPVSFAPIKAFGAAS